MKSKLWKAIEDYRCAGGREEHWARRDHLDALIDDIVDELVEQRALNSVLAKAGKLTEHWAQDEINKLKYKVRQALE